MFFVQNAHLSNSLGFFQAVYKCLLDRVPEEQKDTNVQ